MNIKAVRESIASKASFTFSRSGGPGGQNVNKVNTKVLITVDILIIDGLSSTEKSRIVNRLSSSLKDSKFLSVFVDEERSQFRNREIAINKILAILIKANRIEKRRIPTKPNKSSRQVRLASKKVHATIKSLRKKPISEI